MTYKEAIRQLGLDAETMSVLERFAAQSHRNTRLHQDQERGKLSRRGPKPSILRVSDDSQLAKSLLHRSRDIVTKLIHSPTMSRFGLDGPSAFAFSRTLQPPQGREPDAFHSDDGDNKCEAEHAWDGAQLLQLSDAIRASLRHDNTLGPHGVHLGAFLDEVLRDEQVQQPSMDLDTIEHARLDKLLDELVQVVQTARVRSFGGVGNEQELDLRIRVEAARAKKLRKVWRARFREQFFMIDQLRCADLVNGGRLKDVSFNCALTYDLGKWQTQANDPISELEGTQQFEAGYWWLNITCAQRDGIVSSPLEKPTSTLYGIAALPLLTGKEEELRNDGINIVKYIREGSAVDMHHALMPQVGRLIRVLRGYRLKSLYAPEAGVRYDGLYKLRQYGTKMVDEQTDTHRLELTLERLHNQKTMETLEHVPTPSQLDDWRLYEKLEGDKIKLIEGNKRFVEWSIQRDEEKLDRDNFRRHEEFRTSFAWTLKRP